MLLAELKGKIPSILQNYEDILTSSVLGVFPYLSSQKYIQSVLESCISINGSNVNFIAPIKDCKYEFWPKLESCEPDVLVKVCDEEENEYLVCIEAKYQSDKSSYEDQSIELQNRSNGQRDQLAREIEDIHKDSSIRLMNIKKEKLIKTVLIYLTNDTYLPAKEMRGSIQCVQDIHFPATQMYWLSWREIHNTLSPIKEYNTQQDLKLLSDLKKLLEKKELQSFSGFKHHIESVSSVNITYSNEKNSISWNNFKEVKALKWNYGGILNG